MVDFPWPSLKRQIGARGIPISNKTWVAKELRIDDYFPISGHFHHFHGLFCGF